MIYIPDPPLHPVDIMLAMSAGEEPRFDGVASAFLLQSYAELSDRCRPGGLLSYVSLGRTVPWLYRLNFRTRGTCKDERGEIQTVDHHVVALRFLPDYLRRADRFEMLRLCEPANEFHPNISPVGGGICIEIYPGESLVEICQSLHDLLRWRLRQYHEGDALNREACAWGRTHVDAPLDDRPLFGRRMDIQLETIED
jgi:hypothetical protein